MPALARPDEHAADAEHIKAAVALDVHARDCRTRECRQRVVPALSRHIPLLLSPAHPFADAASPGLDLVADDLRPLLVRHLLELHQVHDRHRTGNTRGSRA